MNPQDPLHSQYTVSLERFQSGRIKRSFPYQLVTAALLLVVGEEEITLHFSNK